MEWSISLDESPGRLCSCPSLVRPKDKKANEGWFADMFLPSRDEELARPLFWSRRSCCSVQFILYRFEEERNFSVTGKDLKLLHWEIVSFDSNQVGFAITLSLMGARDNEPSYRRSTCFTLSVLRFSQCETNLSCAVSDGGLFVSCVFTSLFFFFSQSIKMRNRIFKKRQGKCWFWTTSASELLLSS